MAALETEVGKPGGPSECSGVDSNKNMSMSMVMRQLSLVKANSSHKVEVNAPFLAVNGGSATTRTYLPPRDDTVSQVVLLLLQFSSTTPWCQKRGMCRKRVMVADVACVLCLKRVMTLHLLIKELTQKESHDCSFSLT